MTINTSERKMYFATIAAVLFIADAAYSVNHSVLPCPMDEVAINKKSTTEIASKIKELEKIEACQGLDKTCELRGEGDVAGVWKKHRIFFNNAAIIGSNDMDKLMENVEELQASGICQQ